MSQTHPQLQLLLSLLPFAGDVEDLVLVSKDHRDLIIRRRVLQRGRRGGVTLARGQQVRLIEVPDVDHSPQVVHQHENRVDHEAQSKNHQDGEERRSRFAPVQDEVNVRISLPARGQRVNWVPK